MIRPLAVAALLAWSCPALAAEQIVIDMHVIDAKGVGKSIGTVTAAPAEGKGVTLTPRLTGLPPGEHGFHLHETPGCQPATKDGKAQAGLAAGGHYDPGDTGTHAGPEGKGHLGDLPVLMVGADGKATQAVTAPRLELADLRGRAVVIHAGGDTYSDQPPLGGGGARIACGVVPQ